MTEYALYLESGPKRRTTTVHVPGLLGCTARGPATEAALEATPAAIRAHLAFLRRHGELVDSAFTTSIAAHVMEGSWLGNGDPTPGFAFDFDPLEATEAVNHLRRFAWLRAEFAALLDGPLADAITAQPTAGRSVAAIAGHVAEAQGTYVRYLVGKVETLADALRIVREAGPADLGAALSRVGQASIDRLAAMTAEECNARIPHGQVTWTARRCLRRMLEHEWEHLLELRGRIVPSSPGLQS